MKLDSLKIIIHAVINSIRAIFSTGLTVLVVLVELWVLPVSRSAFEVTPSSVEVWEVEWVWEEVTEWVEFQAWSWLLGDEPSDQRRVQAPPPRSVLLPLPSVDRERQRERERERERERQGKERRQ